MLKPSLPELLAGVADGLATSVLPELGPGAARDELKGALHLMRRIARAMPGMVAYLQTDIAELTATLDQVAPLPGGHGRPQPDRTVVDLERLTGVDLALRAELVAAIGRMDDDTEEILVAALVRLTEREAALRLSPWERGGR